MRTPQQQVCGRESGRALAKLLVSVKVDAVQACKLRDERRGALHAHLAAGVVEVASPDLVGHALHEDRFAVENQGVVTHSRS